VAKKVTAIVCGVSWAVFGLSHLFAGPTGELTTPGLVLYAAGMTIGIFSLIALAIMGIIDYARRPR